MEGEYTPISTVGAGTRSPVPVHALIFTLSQCEGRENEDPARGEHFVKIVEGGPLASKRISQVAFVTLLLL